VGGTDPRESGRAGLAATNKEYSGGRCQDGRFRRSLFSLSGCRSICRLARASRRHPALLRSFFIDGETNEICRCRRLINLQAVEALNRYAWPEMYAETGPLCQAWVMTWGAVAEITSNE